MGWDKKKTITLRGKTKIARRMWAPANSVELEAEPGRIGDGRADSCRGRDGLDGEANCRTVGLRLFGGETRRFSLKSQTLHVARTVISAVSQKGIDSNVRMSGGRYPPYSDLLFLDSDYHPPRVFLSR